MEYLCRELDLPDKQVSPWSEAHTPHIFPMFFYSTGHRAQSSPYLCERQDWLFFSPRWTFFKVVSIKLTTVILTIGTELGAELAFSTFWMNKWSVVHIKWMVKEAIVIGSQWKQTWSRDLWIYAYAECKTCSSLAPDLLWLALQRLSLSSMAGQTAVSPGLEISKEQGLDMWPLPWCINISQSRYYALNPPCPPCKAW